MASQILTTKLYNPPMRPVVIRRPRLIQRLDNGFAAGKSVTLISAPAGFGKTTIISEWLSSAPGKIPYGWVSLDAGDNDPARFLTYLVRSMQNVHPELGHTVLAILQSAQTAHLPDLVDVIVNEISSLSTPFVIVLDDYHLVKNMEVHALVEQFLSCQPYALHLVFITREDPPFALPRMRVQGQLTEIRARDLRFTEAEAQAFLVDAMGIGLTTSEVGKLTDRTEGWAAAIQLAALALDDYPDAEDRQAFIEAFTGSNRYIVDYLISEVLQRQQEVAQQFLLATALFERFCAELADTVVFGEAHPARSRAILNDLEQANMFLVPLDNQRHWYRYHHLFSEMLAHELRLTAPDRIALYYSRASSWFESRGFMLEAVKYATAYATACGDWDTLKRLIDRSALVELFQGQSSLVIDWCRAFPKAYLEQTPEICIYYAWSLVLTFRKDYLDAVEEKLLLAEKAVEYAAGSEPVSKDSSERDVEALRKWCAGHIHVIRSQIMLGHFQTYIDPQELITLSMKALELLPETERAVIAICRINLAHAQTMQNRPLEAQQAFQDVLAAMMEANNFLTGATAVFYLARLAYYLGQIGEAETLCLEWKTKFDEIASASSGDIREIPAARGLDIVRSMILMERNQFDEAEKLLTRAMSILGWATWMELHGFVVLARLFEMRADPVRLHDTLQRMTRLGPQHAACAEAIQIQHEVRAARSDPQVRFRAENWTARQAPQPGTRNALGIGPYHCDAEYFCNLAWARVQIALGHLDEALTFVSPALQTARAHGLQFREVELSIVAALLYNAAGQQAEALTALEGALAIAERTGYACVFDDGPELDKLLHIAIDRNIYAKYAAQLLVSFLHTRPNSGSAPAGLRLEGNQPNLIEALSERETEVLRLLALGLTAREVAERLVLSPNTLKAHTQNIYNKLDAHNRVEAVNKARELGIL